MVRPIQKDVLLLGKKAYPATARDISVANDLLETLRAHSDKCVGMAANMIGFNKSIIAFIHEGVYMEMFNPEIVSRFGEYETEEGCLSLSGTRKTKRNKMITVRYQTRNFEERQSVFTGFTAQIIQHEIDHLNGIVI